MVRVSDSVTTRGRQGVFLIDVVEDHTASALLPCMYHSKATDHIKL